MFNLIDGTVRASSGQLTLGGRQVGRGGRQARARAGLARTYQLPRLFPSLTVLENVVLAEPRLSMARLFLPRVTAAERARAMALLADLGLARYANTSPGTLSYGQRKLIELAQVLWLHPALVLLDEPAAGISPALSQRLAGIIRQLRAEGAGVLLVEHDVAFLASLSDRVYVMANGKIIASGTVAEVSANQAVVDAYLGDQVALAVGNHRWNQRVMIEIKGLVAGYGSLDILRGVDLSRRPRRHHLHRRAERRGQVHRAESGQRRPAPTRRLGEHRRHRPDRTRPSGDPARGRRAGPAAERPVHQAHRPAERADGRAT